MTTLRVGIASMEQFRAYTMSIVRGEHKRGRSEPKLWFSSIGGFANVLSDRNRELLRLIAKTKPQSLDELAKTSRLAKATLSRTLRTLERYGLIRFEKGKGRTLVPRTLYTGVVLDLSLRVPPWAPTSLPAQGKE